MSNVPSISLGIIAGSVAAAWLTWWWVTVFGVIALVVSVALYAPSLLSSGP